MIKKKALRKIIITTFVFFVVLSIYMIPGKKKKENDSAIHYLDTKDVSVYLLNNYQQLTKVNFKVNDSKIEEVIKSIINKLTISSDATIPKNFIQIIPSDVFLNRINFDEGIVSIDLSQNFLKIKEDDIEQVVESIGYSLLELDEVSGVSIYVDGKNISEIYDGIPGIITKEYGINKRIEIKGLKDISKVVIYYIDNDEDTNYYVPITKYVNDDRDKIKIIIDELSSNYVYESNLISLLDKNIKLLDYEIKNDSMTLDFSNSIFMEKDNVLEEVVYSVFANYDVNEIVFKANGKEFCKKSIKIIE